MNIYINCFYGLNPSEKLIKHYEIKKIDVNLFHLFSKLAPGVLAMDSSVGLTQWIPSKILYKGIHSILARINYNYNGLGRFGIIPEAQ